MDITITSQAAEQAKKQLQEQNKSYLRLGLTNGCSGFKYVLRYESEAKETDQHFKSNDISIIVDPKSLTLLAGTEIDWDSSLLKQEFIFKNPNEKASCGCGRSFNT